ncbi:MAG: hypothetical protein C4555_03095, partial [Dehalococcoidia bacterium]
MAILPNDTTMYATGAGANSMPTAGMTAPVPGMNPMANMRRRFMFLPMQGQPQNAGGMAGQFFNPRNMPIQRT